MILQINPINKYLNSREYKLILKKDLFKNKDEGIKKVTDIIKSHVKNQRVTLNSKIDDEKSKNVWYLDTKNHDLSKKIGLLIRVKESKEKQEYKVEFKIRNPDRTTAASNDLIYPEPNPSYEFKIKQYKFEEDVTTPFNSIFSASAVFEYKMKPDLNSYDDIISIYPSFGLNLLDKDEKLGKVNDFEAVEFNPKLGEIEFSNGKTAKMQLSIWYLPNDNNLPCIVEFDIDVDAEKPSNDSDKNFEEFPQSKIGELDELYKKLQDGNIGIADLETSKTKTRFVYEWKYDI